MIAIFADCIETHPLSCIYIFRKSKIPMPIEVPIYSIKPSRIFFLKDYLIAAVFAALYFFLPALGFAMHALTAYAIFGVIAFFIVYVEVFRFSHSYKITPSQVVIEHGIIQKKRDSVFLSSISDVNVKQGYFARFLNYGTIAIGPTSGSEANQMLGIKNPRKIALELEKLIHTYEKGRISKPAKEQKEK